MLFPQIPGLKFDSTDEKNTTAVYALAFPTLKTIGTLINHSFRSFVLDVPDGIDPNQYKAVIVWCESFDEFITAASYR